MTRAELGRRGEQRAAWFYRLRGFAIEERNLRAQGGEVDLVARRGRLVVFCEVKTRQSAETAPGFEAVDAAKRGRLVRMAERWVTARARRDLMIRYDILSLFWNGRRFLVTHFADAFRPVSDPERPWIWRT
jgi:putative endonuclease